MAFYVALLEKSYGNFFVKFFYINFKWWFVRHFLVGGKMIKSA